MLIQWSPEPWRYLGGNIHRGVPPDETLVAVVRGRTPEEIDANLRLMTAAPKAARLLVLLYPGATAVLRELIHAWFSKVGVTLEDLGSSEPPHEAT
jgi:hypothetical protein